MMRRVEEQFKEEERRSNEVGGAHPFLRARYDVKDVYGAPLSVLANQQPCSICCSVEVLSEENTSSHPVVVAIEIGGS